MSTAPYDQQNEADYLEMTRKIEFALEKLREDPTIPANQTSLARLVGCSRGTLYNRKYPLERLKDIKQERLEKKLKSPKKRLSSAYRATVESHLAEKDLLKNQLDKSRSEVSIWVNKFYALERNEKKLKRLVQRHTEFRSIAKKMFEELEESFSVRAEKDFLSSKTVKCLEGLKKVLFGV